MAKTVFPPLPGYEYAVNVELPHQTKLLTVVRHGVEVEGIGSVLTPDQAESFGLKLIAAAAISRQQEQAP